MASTLTVDKAGRIVLPKSFRDQLRLSPGDSLEIESTGEELTLRPVRASGGLHKKQGVWVFQSESPITNSAVEQVRQDIRNERESSFVSAKKRKS